MAAVGGPSPGPPRESVESSDDYDYSDREGNDGEAGLPTIGANPGISHTVSLRERERKIGHRRVDDAGVVTYKKKPTSELMQAIQLGIGQSIGGLAAKAERDVLMQDFAVVEVVFFPSEGSNLTPAHHCSDFRFKTYAPVAFRYFRDLFGIQPEDFMVSLCAEPLSELSNPGASGSIFYTTHDDEFIIKTVQHKEAEFLQKLLPGYFLNISQNKRTLLPKFYGLYCYQCGGKNIRFVVMNNLLPSIVKLHEKYDLKGSTYKRKASKNERSKSSPTLKDLDFIDLHTEGLHLERDTYEALIKTLQRDCRVLESFKIMDYSLLVGVYNLDVAARDKQGKTTLSTENRGSTGPVETIVTPSEKRPARATSLSRGKSFKTRIGQYSTPMESIQANSEPLEESEDEDVPPGGIPARNSKGERLLLYLGIIDILQSFRLKKRLEHTMKAMVIDGDTISVHRPSFYAQRFLNFMATRVFKKVPSALKHSPSKKKSTVRARTQTLNEESSGQLTRVPEKTHRTINFAIDQQAGVGAVGGKPDLVPDTKGFVPSVSPVLNRVAAERVAAERHYQSLSSISTNGMTDRRSEMMTLATYQSEETMGAGQRGLQRYSPPLSVSESTPTHTDHTEGTPSFTASSPSCSSDVLDVNPTESHLTNTANTAGSKFTRVHSSSGVEEETLPSSSKDEVGSICSSIDSDETTTVEDTVKESAVPAVIAVSESPRPSFAASSDTQKETKNQISGHNTYVAHSENRNSSTPAAGSVTENKEDTVKSLDGGDLYYNMREGTKKDYAVRQFGRISLPGSQRLHEIVRMHPSVSATNRRVTSEPPPDVFSTRL